MADPTAGKPSSYRVGRDADQVEQERARLAQLTERADAGTIAAIQKIGVQAGWGCLEVGAGSGTIARWLGRRVGPGGRVRSVDVDTRFHCEVPGHVEVVSLDVTQADLGDAIYDFVHARAVLQHLPERESVLDAMVAALHPGGWLLVEDGDWTGFYDQPLPPHFAELAKFVHQQSVEKRGWDPACGRGLLSALRARGLEKCDARAEGYVMHGGTASAEWYVAGLARGRDRFVEAGFDAESFDRAIAEARDPGFAAVAPAPMQAWGRRPAEAVGRTGGEITGARPAARPR